jgi:DNA-binding NarL/FixJ family response regulator
MILEPPSNQILLSASAESMSQRAGPVALITDDDDFFKIALQTILIGKLGFSAVIEAASLDEAKERLFLDPHISLALFGLATPGIGSAASLAAVRRSSPHVRTALISPSDEKQDILGALEAGIHGYLPKSMGSVEFTSALRLILSGLIYVPPSIASVAPASLTGPSSNGTPARRPSPNGLTPRQQEILDLLVQGKSNKEIARTLNLASGTVKAHMAALFRAFGVNSRSAVAAAGLQLRPDADGRSGSVRIVRHSRMPAIQPPALQAA